MQISPSVACSDSDSARAAAARAARAKKEPGGITTRCVHPRLRGVGDRSGIRKLLCPFRQGTPEYEFTKAFANASELASCRVAAAVGGNRLSLGWFYG